MARISKGIKLIVVVAAVGGALLVGLWVAGGRTSVFTAEIRIATPPERVFAYLSEPEYLKKWVAGVTEIEALTEGGTGVGAKARIVVEESGTRLEMHNEVTRYEPNRLLEFRGTSPVADVVNRFELANSEGETPVKQTMTVQYKGFLMRLFGPFLSGATKSKLNANLYRLRGLLQAEQQKRPRESAARPLWPRSAVADERKQIPAHRASLFLNAPRFAIASSSSSLRRTLRMYGLSPLSQ